MDIRIYHSGSTGNLYRIGNLLLEAGVSIREIKKALDFRLSEIVGCLATHGHLDHSRGAADLMTAGVDLYCSEGMANALGLHGHRLHILQDRKQITIGEWKVVPFVVPHDAEEPMGFLISKGSDKILFATDLSYIPYRFKGLTTIMLSISYDTEILKENIARGDLHVDVGRRVLLNHLSLKTGKEFFKATDTSRVEAIYLLHLSDTNSNAEMFKREIEKIVGKPVYVA